jgi:hypothetical protein
MRMRNEGNSTALPVLVPKMEKRKTGHEVSARQ